MRLRLSPVWQDVWACLAPLAITIGAIGILLLLTALVPVATEAIKPWTVAITSAACEFAADASKNDSLRSVCESASNIDPI